MELRNPDSGRAPQGVPSYNCFSGSRDKVRLVKSEFVIIPLRALPSVSSRSRSPCMRFVFRTLAAMIDHH